MTVPYLQGLDAHTKEKFRIKEETPLDPLQLDKLSQAILAA
jgi:hypothetical protein